MVNDTVNEGYFEFYSKMAENCVRSPNYLPYTIFDRYGNKEVRTPVVPDEGEPVIRMELFGEPPYIFAGSTPRCSDLLSNDLTLGVSEGVGMHRHGVNMSKINNEWIIDLVVPPGETEVSVEVELPEYAWRLSQVGPWTRSGQVYGEVTFFFPEVDDHIIRRDRNTVWGPEPTLWNGYYHLRGNPVIHLELESPWPTETKWEYYVEYFVFDESVCPFGFEWDICR